MQRSVVLNAPGTTASHPGSHRPAAQKVALAILLASAFFVLPYFVAVRPAVSLSYVAGFNNRAAELIFLLGLCTYAWFTRGDLGRTEDTDRSLPVSTLIGALVFVILLCAVRQYASHTYQGTEIEYFLDRQQLLANGIRPWRDMEFP